MVSRARRGVSPIIATFLLIVIAVAGAVVTHAFVSGFMGTTPEAPGASVSVDSISSNDTHVYIYVRNTGSSPVRADIVYVELGGSTVMVEDVDVPIPPGTVGVVTMSKGTLSGGPTYTFKVACSGSAIPALYSSSIGTGGAVVPTDTTPPACSGVGSNTTIAGTPCLFSSTWSDNAGLSGFIFSTNLTGSWVNSSWSAFSGSVASAAVTLPSAGTVVGYRFYANDTSGNWGSSGGQYLTVTVLDTAPPFHSSVSANETLAGMPCLFSSTWSDNVALSGFIFSTNRTGTWVNSSWVPFTGNVASMVTTLPSSAGVVVGYGFYANDTSNNWAATGMQHLTTGQYIWVPENTTVITGYQPPTSDAGNWTNPANAYAYDGGFANSSAVNALQRYDAFGFSLPANTTEVLDVTVLYRANGTTMSSFQTSTGHTTPTACTGTWENPTNAYAYGGGYANTSSDNATVSYGAFGFGSLIPSTATINSVVVQYAANASTATYTNFGNTTLGSSYTGGTLDNTIRGSNFTLSGGSAYAMNITFGARRGSSGSSWTMGGAIYYANNGTLVAYTNNATITLTTTITRYTLNFSTPPLLYNGTAYRIVVWANDATGTAYLAYGAGGSGGSRSSTFGAWANPLTGMTTDTNGYSIYAGCISAKTIGVAATWDGGSTNCTEQRTNLTVGAMANYTYDISGVTSWTVSKLSDANFKVYVRALTRSQINLDWVAVNVTYTTASVTSSITVWVTWDGGATNSSKQNTTLTATMTNYTYNVTGATTWTYTKLQNANFKVYVQANDSNVNLDWLAVNVAYRYDSSHWEYTTAP